MVHRRFLFRFGLLLALAFAPVRTQAQTVAVDSARIERLAALGRLWVSIKYFHPWLPYRAIDWDAALAAWVRAPLNDDQGAALRVELDQLVVKSIIPQRARALAQPPEAFQQTWDDFKVKWTN